MELQADSIAYNVFFTYAGEGVVIVLYLESRIQSYCEGELLSVSSIFSDDESIGWMK